MALPPSGPTALASPSRGAESSRPGAPGHLHSGLLQGRPILPSSAHPSTHSAAGPPLTVHVELNGSLLASGDGLVHAAAGEDTPDVQVCGVNEQLANGGLPLPILQQFLGWDKWETGSG